VKPLRIALIAAAAPLAVACVLLAQPGYQAASCAVSTLVPNRVDSLGKFTSSQIEAAALSTLTGRGGYNALSCRAAEARPGQGGCHIAPPTDLRPSPTTTGPAGPIAETVPPAVTGLGAAPATSTSRTCL